MSEGHQLKTDWFSKPGDSLRSLMQRRNITAAELALNFDGGIATVRGLLDGSIAIDPDRADILSSVVGGNGEFWLKRQANYEGALNRAVAAARSEAEEWLDRVPDPGPKQRGMLHEAAIDEELRRRLAFFNVPTMRSWQERYGRLAVDTRFRTSATLPSLSAAVLLWLRRGELEADLVSTRPWVAGNLEDRLDAIRKLSRIGQPARFLPKLKSLCAEAGVAVVVVKTPPGCHASGATRIVTSDKAMMLLSFRYRADDQFWFTVFHEVGHLLLHGAKTFVDGDETPNDESEREANLFASRCIVPDNRLHEFQNLRGNRDAVMRFSVAAGIAPGLTVGQMQHRGMIEHNRLNSLKRRWTWDDIAPALV